METTNFIRHIINADLEKGKNDGRVHTRFPPEPNGYLHIGHAKSICLNFGLALDYKGKYNLRFDDTNPEKEDVEFIDSIQEDIKWLGFKDYKLEFASNYFDELYDLAVQLIKHGKAYVDSLSAAEMRKYRGTLTEPGKNSPHRDRSVEENLDLFERMKKGEFDEGAHILRAKIDMASPNINMRDPTIYRIKKVAHPKTGDKWCIYPMYDYTHCISDSIEKITHSICTLEFEDHRPLYDWFLDELKCDPHPQQIEFAKLALNYVVMGKRKLKQLVEENYVSGWDDPRMPTLVAFRRRGYTPASIRELCDRVGVTKKKTIIDMGVLEDCIRGDLNESALRKMAVLDPIKLVIEDYEGSEEVDSPNHPQKPEMGKRKLHFSKELYIERSDFMEEPPKKFFRLGPDREVRLRNAYIVKCVGFEKDGDGKISLIKCTHDKDTLGKNPADGRKVKGIIHWVSAEKAVDAEVRVYDRLFSDPAPDGDDFLKHLNPDSLHTMKNCKVEASLGEVEPESRFQFERQGYFCADRYDSKPGKPVFNRTVTLRDTWAKIKTK